MIQSKPLIGAIEPAESISADGEERQPHAIPDDTWRHLTSVAAKRHHYERDPYFREALSDGRACLGSELLAVLHQIALVVIKPEALTGRRVEAILRFMTTHSFTPVHLVPVTYTRHIIRELWRFQWNAATIEKMALADQLNCALPTAMLLLRDDRLPRKLPAPVRLKTLKGDAIPARRDAGSLRGMLAAPNRMITFVHTADEPADTLRELGIFCDRPARRKLFSMLLGDFPTDTPQRCAQQLGELEREAPYADFDADLAWQRLLAGASTQTAAPLARQYRLFRDERKVDWWPFLLLCARIEADRWDVIAICAQVVEHESAGQKPLLTFDPASITGWLSDEAQLCRR
jgi:Nucleoside diphosphate kinase